MGIAMMDKSRAGRLRSVFMMAIVLMAALACAKVARSRVEPKRAQGAVVYASTRNVQDPNAIKPILDEVKGVVEAMKKKNLFVKEPPKEHPIKQIDGILGDEILIGDNWYKVGAQIGEAKVVAIEPTEATIEWNGQAKAFAPLASPEDKPSLPSERPVEKPKNVKGPELAKPEQAPEQVDQPVVESAAAEDPLGWMGIDLPPKAREKLLGMWHGLSDEEKAKAKEEWNNMSDEDRRQGVEMMQNM